ncbi:MAG: GyrI-like domain-containing protein [Gemmatimonadaceae bacterium]|nr:GyrI-like domain-containing protein [Chitinophagaceae bacterium]
MTIKSHPAVRILYSSHRTTISQLSQLAGTVAKKLMADAVSNEFLISGPIYWIYEGMDGKPDTVFYLDIAVPVQGPGQSQEFEIKEMPAFHALTYQHEGSWEEMGDSYALVFKEISTIKARPSGVVRELYLNIDFENQCNNRTEIQVGL